MTATTVMVLAAGEGRRMRPLTDTIPKPLLPVGEQSHLTRLVRWLDRCGFDQIVVNVHHLADQVIAALQQIEASVGAGIAVSRETSLLGTGGGIRQASELWSGSGAWVFNGDVVADVEFDPPADTNGAHMILRPSPDARTLGPVFIGNDGLSGPVVGLLDHGLTAGTARMFTGIHYISKRLAATLPETGCVVRDGYLRWIEDDVVTAALHQGYWNEIGTPTRYRQVQDDFAAGRLAWLGE